MTFQEASDPPSYVNIQEITFTYNTYTYTASGAATANKFFNVTYGGEVTFTSAGQPDLTGIKRENWVEEKIPTGPYDLYRFRSAAKSGNAEGATNLTIKYRQATFLTEKAPKR